MKNSNGPSRRLTIASLVLGNLLLTVFAVTCYRSVQGLESRVKALEIPMASYVQIGNHIFVPKAGESAKDFAARVYAEMQQEGAGGFTCETLTGCNVPGGEIIVCASSPSELADLVAEFCPQFRCDDCP